MGWLTGILFLGSIACFWLAWGIDTSGGVKEHPWERHRKPLYRAGLVLLALVVGLIILARIQHEAQLPG